MVTSHPAKDLLIAIAEGKQMERDKEKAGFWMPCGSYEALRVIGLGIAGEIRIARPMVERTVRYPEPLRELPESGKSAWCISPEYTVVQLITSRELLKRFFNAGMAFATEADAAEAHKALFGGGND